jgi:hypothetical protein
MQCLGCGLNSTDAEQGPVMVPRKQNVWGTQELRISWTHARLSASHEFCSTQLDTCSKQMSHSWLFPVSRPDMHIGLSMQMATGHSIQTQNPSASDSFHAIRQFPEFLSKSDFMD